MTCLIVLWSKLVQALLNDMVTIQVLDQNNNMEAKCDDDGVNLSIVAVISLMPPT